jgi:hypothetical protein
MTEEMLRTVFNALPHIHYVFISTPKGALPAASIALSQCFHPVALADSVDPENLPCDMHVSFRHQWCPILHVRCARVEDHDDLTPIFKRQNNILTSTYGDYFLAELIEAQDESNKAIVAEVDGTAIGFMSVSCDVDIDLLDGCFELGPYHGLRKQSDDDTWEERTASESRPSSAASSAFEPDIEQERSCSTTVNEKQQQDSASRPISAVSSVISRSAIGSPQGSLKSVADIVKPKLSTAQFSRQNSTSSYASVSASSTYMKRQGSIRPDEGQLSRGGSLGPEMILQRSVSGRIEDRLSVVGSTSAVAVGQQTESIVEKLKVKAPVFKGQPNAFAIQLFCMDEKYEMRSVDMLPAVFELFPDRDFCVVTQPHLVPEYPLLQSFTRISPSPTATLHQELYVAHRCSLIEDVLIRECTLADRDAIAALTEGIDNRNSLMSDIDNFNAAKRDPLEDGGTPLNVVIAECADQVVGVSVVRDEKDIEFIRSHYDIESFIYFAHHRRDEHAHLHHFVLNPIFSHFSKQLLKETLRLSHKSCLYYPIYPEYSVCKASKAHTLASCLHDFVPVRARRQIQYPLERLGKNAPSERITQTQEPYALYHINRKLTLEPKITINARIVVVGASNVGLSFLETLAFSPHLRFNNLTVISPDGLQWQSTPDSVRDSMLPSSHYNTRHGHAQTSILTWVNVVKGKMSAINREKKIVSVLPGAQVPYDLLVLCTGRQYQASLQPRGALPKHVYTLNCERDCKNALMAVRAKPEGCVVVYGTPLAAYSCIHALIAANVAGTQISLVQPPSDSLTGFNNPVVDEKIANSLEELGISFYQNFSLKEWNDGCVSEGDELYSATFVQGEEEISLDCSIFFCFDRLGIDHDAFKAINDCCLVFDGRLVVDADFQTTDKSIRGAGSLTKFARRYHADQWSLGHFNSKEVGQKLALSVLRDYDPVADQSEKQVDTNSPPLIPSFASPKVSHAKVPGQFTYLHVAPPALETPFEIAKEHPHYGRDLVTDNPESGYFRLQVDVFNRIRQITCLTKQEVDVDNWVTLFGLNEKYLNSLVARFDEGLIKDFYSYFREPWAMAVFHDRFGDFHVELKELLASKTSQDAPSLEERISSLLRVESEVRKTENRSKVLFIAFTRFVVNGFHADSAGSHAR